MNAYRMQAWHVCAVLSMFVSVGCRSRTADDPAHRAVVVESDVGVRAVMIDEPWQMRMARMQSRFEGSGVTQENLAALLVQGFSETDPRAAEVVLRTLSRELARWRRDWSPEVVSAVEAFAAPGREALWAGVDARFVMPAIEVLSDARRWDAVLRLTEYYRDSAVEEALRGPRAIATSMLAAGQGMPPEGSAPLAEDGSGGRRE